MQITRTDNSPTNIQLVINAGPDELEPIKKHVLTHFSDVRVPGFRAGRAPAHLIEKHIDQRRLLDEFMEHAINELYRRAVDQENIRPIGQPKIELKKFVPFTQLEFETTQDIIGSIELPNYKSMKLAKPSVQVTAKDVDEVLKSMRGRAAERVEVKRPAKTGDEVVLDFEGKDPKGEPIAGAAGKDYPLVLGSKSFIPGFEENVAGLKAGDKKDFTVTFPKDYGVSDLQNKKVTFSVEIKKISELNEPKLDDELARQVGPFKTLAEMKADIKKQLAGEKQRQAERDYESELIKKISDKSKVAIPEPLVEEQTLRLEEEEKRNLTYRGQTWQEHLRQEGITEQQHRQRHRPEATDRVKAGLVLSEVSIKEGIEVLPEEVENRIMILKGQYQDEAMRAELDKPENRQDIAARLLTEKTIQKLVDYASK